MRLMLRAMGTSMPRRASRRRRLVVSNRRPPPKAARIERQVDFTRRAMSSSRRPPTRRSGGGTGFSASYHQLGRMPTRGSAHISVLARSGIVGDLAAGGFDYRSRPLEAGRLFRAYESDLRWVEIGLLIICAAIILFTLFRPAVIRRYSIINICNHPATRLRL